MSRENVVISMDGHTEAFLDLKAWMPNRTHAAFDEAMAEGRRTFAGANRFWADLVYAVKILVPNRAGVLKIGMPADVALAAVAPT